MNARTVVILLCCVVSVLFGVAQETFGWIYPNGNNPTIATTGNLGWHLEGHSETTADYYTQVIDIGNGRMAQRVNYNPYTTNPDVYRGWAGLSCSWDPTGQQNVTELQVDISSSYPWKVNVEVLFGPKGSQTRSIRKWFHWPNGTLEITPTTFGVTAETFNTISGIWIGIDGDSATYGGGRSGSNPMWFQVSDQRLNGTLSLANVTYYGATGDGTDDTDEIQEAVNSGYSQIYFPRGTYILSNVVDVGNGNVTLYGEGDLSIIKSDSTVFVLWQPGIYIHHLRFENITAPFLVDRIGEGQGYQPQDQDFDIWENLTPEQQSQDIGPQIRGYSVDNIHIKYVTGEFLSIILWNTQNSIVENCNFRAGKNWIGGIVFWKDDPAHITLGGRISNNTVRYASYSGIAVAGGDGVEISNNYVEKCGESGIKTCQPLNGHDLRCKDMLIRYNTCVYNYWDGMDVTCDNPPDGSFDTRGITNGLGTRILNNILGYNWRTGMYLEGSYFTVQNNQSHSNGLNGYYCNPINNTTIKYNYAHQNNLTNNTGGEGNEFGIVGSNLTIRSNQAVRDYRYNGYGFHLTLYNTWTVYGNTRSNCAQWLNGVYTN